MRRLRLVFALLLATSLLGGGSVQAANNVSAKLNYHISDAFIQAGVGVPQTGAVAQAANNHRVRITGSGTLNTASRKATGGGSFVHTDASGALLAFGTWTATGVQSITVYPCGGDGLPSNFCGGTAVFNVHLDATSTSLGAIEADALLTMDCEINPPVAGVEGVKLNISGLLNFNTTVESEGGLTVFVSRSHP